MDTQTLKNLSVKQIVLIVIGLIVALGVYSTLRGVYQGPMGMESSRDSIVETSAPSMGAYDMADGAKNLAYDSDESYASERMMMPAPVPQAPAPVSQIIRSAELALIVDDVDESARAIEQIRVEFAGQVGNITVRDYATSRYGEMTIWIPSASFDTALERIKKSALRVVSESVSASDVSAQFVDLEARLKNLRATEEQYLQIMKRSGTISDVLSVQRALSETRQSIEQIEGQLKYLSRQVAMSSVHITLTQEVVSVFSKDEWRPWAVVKNAFRETSRDFTRFIDAVLVFLVMLPVLLLKIAFWCGILYAVFFLARILYRRMRGASLPNTAGKV